MTKTSRIASLPKSIRGGERSAGTAQPRNDRSARMIGFICFVALFFVGFSNLLFSQQGSAKKGPPELPVNLGKVDPDDTSPLAKKYLEALEELRAENKAIRKLFILHHTERLEETRYKYIEEWNDAIGRARQAYAKVIESACDLYASDTTKYSSFGEMLFFILKVESEGDRFEGLTRIARCLFDAKYSHPQLLEMAITSAIAENRFEDVFVFFEATPQSPESGAAKEALTSRQTAWNKEQEIRQKEALADDLPRVELVTTKGTMVIELFENEAPLAVNAFVYLVDRGFYNGKSFFRVLEHFVAQTGCERGDGTGSAGYTIKGEMHEPNARPHFRGSLGVALGIDPKTGKSSEDSGSAQFYICLMPQAFMDGKYCVFGRVIQGLDSLGEITRVDPADKKDEKKKESSPDPDIIVKSKVLRKRDHEYKVTPLQGSVSF